MNRRQHFFIVATTLFIVSILPMIYKRNLFGLGVLTEDLINSVFWLMLMYIVGAYIGKYDAFSGVKPVIALMGYIMCFSVNPLLKMMTMSASHEHSYEKYYYLFRGTSLPTVFSAVFLLLLFRKMKLSLIVKKIIAVFSPLSFSVYLIHNNTFIRDNLLVGRFAHYADFSAPKMIGATLLTALVIMLTCLFIDFFRARLFDFLRVKERVSKLEKSFLKIYGTILPKRSD